MNDPVSNPRYRWIALIASGLAYSLCFGMLQSVGVLYPEWIRAFQAPASYLSFIGSFPTAIGCMAGPICGVLVKTFGCRTCGIAGGILTFIGRCSCYFATSVPFLAIAYSVLPGIGAVLTLVGFSSIVNSYFIKERSIAESVLGGGLCFGNFFTAFLLQKFVEAFSWEGAMLLSGAVSLNVCVCGMFFIPKGKIADHPLNLWKVHRTTDQHLNELNHKTVSETSIHGDNTDVVQKSQDGFLTRSRQLWKDPFFLLIAVCDFLTWMALLIPYIQLTEKARLLGVEPNLAAWLSSTFGIAGIVGRPTTAGLSTYFKIHPLWAYSINQAILGAATVFSPHWTSIPGLFTTAVLVGFFSNGYGFIKTSVAVMIGRQHFVDAYSWMLFLEGVAICAGPFLAGMLADATNSYDWSFRFSGLLLLTSASLCLLKIPLQKFRIQNFRKKYDYRIAHLLNNTTLEKDLKKFNQKPNFLFRKQLN